MAISLIIHLENVVERELMEYVTTADDPRFRKKLAELRQAGVDCYNYDIIIFVKLNRDGYFMINGRALGEIDGTDPASRTRAYITERGKVDGTLELFRRYWPGTRHATLRAVSSLGVRETRRIKAIGYLSVQDVLDRRRFDDTIGYRLRVGHQPGSRGAGGSEVAAEAAGDSNPLPRDGAGDGRQPGLPGPRRQLRAPGARADAGAGADHGHGPGRRHRGRRGDRRRPRVPRRECPPVAHQPGRRQRHRQSVAGTRRQDLRIGRAVLATQHFHRLHRAVQRVGPRDRRARPAPPRASGDKVISKWIYSWYELGSPSASNHRSDAGRAG